MGVQTTYLQMYLPADNELFDEQLNTNTSLQKVDAGVLVEHNGWTAHAAAPSPHTGHAVFTANTFTGQQTVQVAADAPAQVYDVGALVAAGVQTGERVIYRANSYDGVNHQRSFMWRVRTTSNAGNGVFELLTTLDAQTPPTVLQSIDQAGNMTRFGTQTYTVGADLNGIILDPGVLAAAGTQNGERVVYRAHSFDVGDHYRDFVWRPRTTSNAGAGVFELLTLLDGGGQAVLASVSSAGSFLVGPPASGTWTVWVTGNATASQSYGILARAGTNSSDSGLQVSNQAGTATYINVKGDGSVNINPNSATIGALSALYVSASGSASSAAAVSIYGMTTSGNSFGQAIHAGYTSGDFGLQVTNQTASSLWLNVRGDGQVSVGPPSTAIASMIITAPANIGGLYVNGDSTTGQSFGLQVQAGTSGSDWCFGAYNRASSYDLLLVRGSGAITMNSSGTLAGQTELSVNGQSGGFWTQQLLSYNATGHGLQIQAGDGTSTYTMLGLYTRAGTTSKFTITSNGAATFNPSQTLVGASTMTVYAGAEAQVAVSFYGAGVSGSSYGLQIFAGYVGDYAAQFYNRSSQSLMIIQGNGLVGLGGGIGTSQYFTAGQFYGLSTPNIANASGQVLAQSHPTYSSVNFKINIQSFLEHGRSALDLVQAIRGVRYGHRWATQQRAKNAQGVWDWRVDHHETPSVGFIAEEVMPHLPEVIARDNAGNMGLDYGRMVPVLWEAVKELAAKVAALEAQLQPGG